MPGRELRRAWLVLRQSGFSERQAGDVIRIATIEEAVQERKQALDWLTSFEKGRSYQSKDMTGIDEELVRLEYEWINFCLGSYLPRETFPKCP